MQKSIGVKSGLRGGHSMGKSRLQILLLPNSSAKKSLTMPALCTIEPSCCQIKVSKSALCRKTGRTSSCKCLKNNCYSCNNYFLGIYKTKSFLFCDKGPILTPWSGNKMALWYTELALSKTFWPKNLATIGFGVLTFPSNGPLEVQTWLQWTSALITKSKVPIFMKV